MGRNCGEGSNGSISPLCLPGDDLDLVLSVCAQCLHHGTWLCHQLICRFTDLCHRSTEVFLQVSLLKLSARSIIGLILEAEWERKGEILSSCWDFLPILLLPSHFNVADETLVQNVNCSSPKEVNNEMKFSHLHYCLKF